MTNNINLSLEKKKAIGLVHKIYNIFKDSGRKYLANTKTRGEVQGGGKKPWKQKGTGRARAGSIRSPLWKGGGIAFGPRTHNVNLKINKRERKVGIFSAFYLKQNNIKVIENHILDTFKFVKTKEALKFLNSSKIHFLDKTLILLSEQNIELLLSLRNLRNIQIALIDRVTVDQILNSTQIILDKNGLNLFKELYGQY